MIRIATLALVLALSLTGLKMGDSTTGGVALKLGDTDHSVALKLGDTDFGLKMGETGGTVALKLGDTDHTVALKMGDPTGGNLV